MEIKVKHSGGMEGTLTLANGMPSLTLGGQLVSPDAIVAGVPAYIYEFGDDPETMEQHITNCFNEQWQENRKVESEIVQQWNRLVENSGVKDALDRQ